MLDKARKVQTFFIKGLLQSVDVFRGILAGALPGARRMWQSHVSSVCGRAPNLPMGRHNGYEDETRDSGSKYVGSLRRPGSHNRPGQQTYPRSKLQRVYIICKTVTPWLHSGPTVPSAACRSGLVFPTSRSTRICSRCGARTG